MLVVLNLAVLKILMKKYERISLVFFYRFYIESFLYFHRLLQEVIIKDEKEVPQDQMWKN